jgi:DNA polymerase-3 subunit alpha
MAFGVLEDYNGSIETVIFPDIFDELRPKLAVDRVYCIRGSFDASRGKPSLQIKELLDPAQLKEKSWRELHIRLVSPSSSSSNPGNLGAYAEDQLVILRDAIYSMHGACSLILHVPYNLGKGEAIIKAGAHISCSGMDKDVEAIQAMDLVQDVWRD